MCNLAAERLICPVMDTLSSILGRNNDTGSEGEVSNSEVPCEIRLLNESSVLKLLNMEVTISTVRMTMIS